jgi:hypothetical protein
MGEMERKKREKTMSETHPERLSEQVIREIERFGGVIEPPPEDKVTTVLTPVGDVALPEPMRQLLCDVRWPVRQLPGASWPMPVTCCSKDDEFPYGVRFGWATVEENYGYDGFDGNLPYTEIGMDDSQFLYFIRLDDEDPTDPVVYRVDHEGQPYEPGAEKRRKFLASLEPEG